MISLGQYELVLGMVITYIQQGLINQSHLLQDVGKLV